MNQHVFLIDKDFFYWGGGLAFPTHSPEKQNEETKSSLQSSGTCFVPLLGSFPFSREGTCIDVTTLVLPVQNQKKQLSCNVGPGNHPATLLNPGNVVPSKNWLPTYLYKINPSHATPWCNQNTRFLCLRLAPFTTCHPNVWLESLINTTRTRAAGKGRSLVGQWLLYNW